ncbi:MAG: hypothetical protein AAFW89_01045 [Bacteroidota bacterium]
MNFKALLAGILFLTFGYLFTACDLLGIGSNDNDRDPVLPDTTSSQFTWRVDTVGFINTFLRDVAIIDSNNIWVVGEIPERDFGGANDYNAMRWDGEQWNLERVIIESFSGNRRAANLYSVYPQTQKLWFGAFNGGYATLSQDIWFTEFMSIHGGSIFEITGDQSEDVFISGNNGILVRFNGSSFFRIPTSLSADITFMDYANDTLKFGGVDTLLQYIDGVLQPEFEPDASRAFRLSGGFTDVWHSGTHWWYSTGSGLYRFEPDSGYVQLSQRGISFLTGNSSQDVFTTDRVRFGYHWNGRTVTSFNLDALVPEGIAFINGIDMKQNLLVVTGWTEGLRGFILTGKRTAILNQMLS